MTDDSHLNDTSRTERLWDRYWIEITLAGLLAALLACMGACAVTQSLGK